jgi:hypothetical protein
MPDAPVPDPSSGGGAVNDDPLRALVDDATEVWAGEQQELGWFAIAVETSLPIGLVAVAPEPADPGAVSLRLTLDGSPIASIGPLAGGPARFASLALAPGVHDLVGELSMASRPALVRRILRFRAESGRGVIVRAEVGMSGAGPLADHAALYLATREVARVDPATLVARASARVAEGSREIGLLLRRKERARDVVWVICLRDKAAQIHAVERALGEARAAFASSQAIGGAGATVALSRIFVDRRRAATLVAEARQCVSS